MRTALLALLALTTLTLKSQPYGNEWISYGAKYFYFPVAREGIYRIDSLTLAQVPGFQLATIDPRNFRIFADGREIPVYIDGEQDGVFNQHDYIEFYARGNDGSRDTRFYDDSAHHANPFYSLFNDTVYYYLTWNNSTANLRALVETDQSFASYTPETFYWRELWYTRPNDDAVGYGLKYYFGQRIGGLTNPAFGLCAGWMDVQVNYGGTRNIAFPTPGVYASGPPAEAEVTFTSQSDAVQAPDHHMRVLYNNSQVVYDTIFDAFQTHHVQFNIAPSQLTNVTSLQVRSVNDLNPAPASQSFAVGYSRIRYPHTPNLENKKAIRVILQETTQAKYYLNASSFQGTHAVMYDVSNGVKIIPALSGNNLQALVPNTGSEKVCFIADTSAVINVGSLKPVTPTGEFTDFGLYTGNMLIITHSTLLTSVYSYAAFRATSGLNPVVADIEELYHQFGHGIRKHPSSIRNFVDYASDNWQDSLKYLFLAGKSVHAYETRLSAQHFEDNLVPSLGAKSSDILLTSSMNGAGWGPSVATGRLAARTTADVDAYLAKATAYTNTLNNPELWHKRVAHFHGGSSVAEQQLLSAYLNGFKSIISDTLFGGRVIDFYKSTTVPVQSGSLFDTIKRTIESGTALLTFFGHAAGSSFDINIDNASSYNNTGKYPLLLANSCLVGDLHLPNTGVLTTSEDFVLSPGRGAIGFIASVGLGTAPELYTISSEIYRQLAAKNYQGAIGTSIKRAMDQAEAWYPNHLILRYNVQQMNFHGDPSLDFYGQDLPDLEVAPGQAWFYPSLVSAELDSFSLFVAITNKGRAFNEEYVTRVIRKYPDGSTDTLFRTRQGSTYADTLEFRFPVNVLKGTGENLFTIEADDASFITESAELNNLYVLQLNISSDAVIPVWPYKYAVVPSVDITLHASTGDPFLTSKAYRFEVDTAWNFSSAVKETAIIQAPGGLISYKPQLTAGAADSTVYYWRVSPDHAGGQYKWRNSSFQVISNQQGWGQAAFPQFSENDLQYLGYDTLNSRFVLDTSSRQLICNNIGNPATPVISYGIEYKIDATIQDYAGCGWSPALHVVVIDSVTLEPWGKKWTDNSVNPPVTYNPTHNFGNMNNESACRNRVEKYFIFSTSSTAQMDAMADMLNTKIPSGNYVMVYSYLNNMRSQWTPALASALSGLGAQVNALNDSIPFIFFTRMGDPSSAVTVTGTDKQDAIQLSVPLYSYQPYGRISSVTAGPALEWESFSMVQESLETPSADSIAVSVFGITRSGQESVLATYYGHNPAETDLGQIVDAQTYPWIRLEAHEQDDSLRTAPQLKRWHLIYQPAPELAVDPKRHFLFEHDELQEGQPLRAEMAVTNVSGIPLDSVYVHWRLEGSNQSQELLKVTKAGADSTFIATLDMPTHGRDGSYILHLEVNPKDSAWKKEKEHFNNLAAKKFNVAGDETNSLLDVTFDGRHILNRDIVSPEAVIVVRLKDENPWSAVQDTSAFRIYLTAPSGTVNRLWFSPSISNPLLFSVQGKSSQITWNADLKTDGIYSLRVQAYDEAIQQDLEYHIEFEVITESSITHVMNYPNPFSTSTRFVFTLTGSKVPDNFRIQIMTVTGKVVREINRDELGSIYIGRNITDFAWDGRDQYGDRLANGIYLYRVITGIEGKEVEHRTSGADPYFTRGFGKMYLLGGN